MEVSFSREIESLRLGASEEFHGEGILAITKGLLQSGVAYVGGYQGAPVSHLLDVLVQASEFLAGLGVKVQACSNEASAAALLGASIHYPMRGAVTWKSVVGTNVASDALSNLASVGVTGGALIVVGEDYGEGASVIQERTLAFALKSSLCLLDPRPDLSLMVRMVEEGFLLSEASSMPVIMQLRIRACHVRGSFIAKDNVSPALSVLHPNTEPAAFSYARLAHPPATFRQEKHKASHRIPAARAQILARELNEVFDGSRDDLGFIVQGGLYNTLMRTLQLAGLADAFGQSEIPLLVLNVTCPLVPEQIERFCEGKRAVLMIEEGQPEFIEQEVQTILRRAHARCEIHGKDLLMSAGEYTVESLTGGIVEFAHRYATDLNVARAKVWMAQNHERRDAVHHTLGTSVPPRPPGFCIGCPERPVFSALKLLQEEIGPIHIAADIGCHAFATFEPFNSGHSILGYGMSLASAAGVAPIMKRRTLAVMGDGGFWHNGLLSGVQSSLFNADDVVLLILKNGYTSATGTQDILSSPNTSHEVSRSRGVDPLSENQSIEHTLAGIGVKWIRTTSTYDVGTTLTTLRDAFSSEFAGLKVIIGEGECQLEKQRRVRPQTARALERGERVVRTKYGVDEEVCSGDHSCIRLSGCPTLTLKTASDPLRVDPVVTIEDGCVGCGLCGANAHAATLCPSFYRIEQVKNPHWMERILDRLRRVLSPGVPEGGRAGPAEVRTT